MGKTVVRLSGVSKSYSERAVLKDVSLELESGGFYALVGHNGAGKSTLLRLLARLEAVTAGEGTLLGYGIDEDRAELNARVGYLSEDLDVAMPGSIREFYQRIGPLYPRWKADVFARVTGELGVPVDRHFRELSRGQRMHVALAAALASGFEVLLLDEITSVLDAQARGYLMARLAEFVRAGGTVVMATNIVTETHHFADRLILIEEGCVRFNSRVDEIAARFVRLRQPKGSEHPVFARPDCAVVGINSDGSLALLAPREAADSVPRDYLDPGSPTTEDACVYFNKVRKAG
jgi:ABC-2 type transport system ATP-binding protein